MIHRLFYTVILINPQGINLETLRNMLITNVKKKLCQILDDQGSIGLH